jgi:hypothetical protein
VSCYCSSAAFGVVRRDLSCRMTQVTRFDLLNTRGGRGRPSVRSTIRCLRQAGHDSPRGSLSDSAQSLRSSSNTSRSVPYRATASMPLRTICSNTSGGTAFNRHVPPFQAVATSASDAGAVSAELTSSGAKYAFSTYESAPKERTRYSSAMRGTYRPTGKPPTAHG